MRKEKMLTRTVKTTVYEIELVNRETHEFRTETHEVTEEKQINNIKTEIQDEGIEIVVNKTIVSQKTVLYGMPLTKFMEMAKPIEKTDSSDDAQKGGNN